MERKIGYIGKFHGLWITGLYESLGDVELHIHGNKDKVLFMNEDEAVLAKSVGAQLIKRTIVTEITDEIVFNFNKKLSED